MCILCFYSRNLLSTLPKYLFNLPLKVLVVSNNKLLSVPEEIGKAKELMELVSTIPELIKKNHCSYIVTGLSVCDILLPVFPCRTSAVMRYRCCPLRWGGSRPYGNSTSGGTVFTCCLRVCSSLRSLPWSSSLFLPPQHLSGPQSSDRYQLYRFTVLSLLILYPTPCLLCFLYFSLPLALSPSRVGGPATHQT